MKHDGKNRDEDADGLDARNDAALWALLGRAEPPRAGPYFARRVLREVGLHEEAQTRADGAPAVRWRERVTGFWRACRRLRRLALVAGAPMAAVALLFLGLGVSNPWGHARLGRGPAAAAVAAPASSDADFPDASPGPSVAANALPEDVTPQDVEVIADLDTLLTREENRQWTEDTARF